MNIHCSFFSFAQSPNCIKIFQQGEPIIWGCQLMLSNVFLFCQLGCPNVEKRVPAINPSTHRTLYGQKLVKSLSRNFFIEYFPWTMTHGGGNGTFFWSTLKIVNIWIHSPSLIVANCSTKIFFKYPTL